jgi:hypothetical protein
MAPAAGIAIGLAIAMAIIIRLSKNGSDRDRINRYIAEQGGEVESIRWAPLSRGWLESRDSRMYAVTYRESTGIRKSAICRTSGWIGVYLSIDGPTRNSEESDNAPPSPEQRMRDLEQENARLRKELEARDNVS